MKFAPVAAAITGIVLASPGLFAQDPSSPCEPNSGHPIVPPSGSRFLHTAEPSPGPLCRSRNRVVLHGSLLMVLYERDEGRRRSSRRLLSLYLGLHSMASI
jgi:hypothetical protein